ANYLRHVLRQDPNIIMVGEIRDFETAEIAIRAALTGHLVFSTIHTNDSVSTITRLIDMGVAPYLLAPSLHMVVAQRLIRKLCPECKEPAPSSNFLPAGTEIYQAKGCHFCNETGYWGRIGIYEILEITPRLRELFTQKASYGTWQEEAKKEGMKSLFDVALSKTAEGITSLEEVLGIVENP
ncbi:MAG: ATPase, T2SS/T4P/T4SS family, partial [Candidatus Ratteibacteria bacterium]